MSKPARGTKRVCPSCGARFPRLSRTPITCPVCQAVYQVSPPTSRRSERGQPVEVKKVVEPEVEAPVLESADVISLEEVEEPGSEAVAEEGEEIVDLGDDAPEFRPETTTTHFSKRRRKARRTSPTLSGHRARKPRHSRRRPTLNWPSAFFLNRLNARPK